MGKWDVRLISASYKQENDDVVVELFGKTRDKRSIVILDRRTRPYFFVVAPRDNIRDELSKDGNVLSVEDKRLFLKGEERNVIKITIKYPWDVPSYRNRFRKDHYTVLAADIPFHHRYLYDNDMGACISVTGDEVANAYATDIAIEMSSFENIESFDPGLRILSFDIENSIANETIYTICSVIGEDGKIRECAPIYGNEKEIIEKFSEHILKEDPDVISGYNIDNYDIKMITDRAKKNRISEVRWGRDRGQPRVVSEKFWRLKGRLVIDAWWAVRRELRPKQETLNAVSLQLLGEQKMDVDPKKMDQEWKDDPKKVMRYCIKDAELSLRILNTLGTVRKGMDLAAVSKLPLEDVLTSGSSQLIDSILIRKADRSNVGVPLTGDFDRSEQIEGGYVHTMAPGLYHWVCVLDFKSMYPSLIISKNICFTTLSKDGEIVSPGDGARYMSKDRKVGILPGILDGLLKERDAIKKRMRTASEYERHYLDGLQNAVKILMNSFYGVFASSFYRFTDKNIGSSITAFARATVKGIISELEKEGVQVIYSDTDSIFIRSPHDDLENTLQFGSAMAKRYSAEGRQLEFEKIMEPLFSHGKKKRYVGKVLWPKEELLIRGYEVRRSDSFDLQSRLLTELFEKILEEKNEEAVALVKRTVQDTMTGKADVSDLVISRTCKGFGSYESPDRMANVQAAKKMMDMGYEFIPGMKVSWIVTDSSVTPQVVEPYVSGVPFTGRPDNKYYAERLANMASRVTEVFGWSEKDLMLGSQQATLFDTNFHTAPMPSTKKEEKKDAAVHVPKKTSLKDFF
ncbi:MAG: DNA polymerase II [Methanomassiliicoccaceae archaeon]|jgi:DNA polymerase I|nr:DNA polymerase II [Methanomassiliicoccaceae archaeon]